MMILFIYRWTVRKLVSESTDSKNIFIIQTHYVFKNGPNKVIFGPFSIPKYISGRSVRRKSLQTDLSIVWVEFKKAIKFLSMRMEVIWYHYIKEGDRLPQKNSVFMLLKYFLVSQVRLSEVFWAEYRLLAQIMVEISPTWALHNLNICHRHLCPEAILISGTGHCKISRLHRATLMNHPCKMTEDVGVTGYKAPEVAACDKEGNHQGSTDV